MNTVETEPNTAESLAEWYTKQSDGEIIFDVAVDPSGIVLGFSGLYRLNTNLDRYFGIYLVVERNLWGQGLGSLLYDHLLVHAADVDAHHPASERPG